MKVGISYQVELEDVPEELGNLIKHAQWDLKGILDKLVDEINSGNYSAALKNIKNIRYNLQRADSRLEDCQAILSGYINVLQELAKQQGAHSTLQPGQEDASQLTEERR
jgi:hypothetical protein